MAEEQQDDTISTEIEEPAESELLYTVEEVPPWYIAILLGFQHYLTFVGGSMALPFFLAPSLCIEVGSEIDAVAIAELIGTQTLVSGIATLLQCTFGSRLPVVQAQSAAYFPPTLALLSSFGQCPTVLPASSNITEYMMNSNSTETVVISGSSEHREVWQTRMRALQGAITVAAVFEVLLGFTGLIGILRRYIGPLVIAPTICLIGLSLFPIASDLSSKQWGIALLSVASMVIFSQYLSKVKIPSCSKGKKSNSNGIPIFNLFPIILTIIVGYIVCTIFTYTNVFPDDKNHAYYKARIDSRASVLTNANWFHFPYPGQWGLPTVTVAGVVGMLAAVIASSIESVGDYYAAARLSGAPPPTTSAINRGIGLEGISCILAGIWGSGNGTTSQSSNIGSLSITKVGSRRVIHAAGLITIVLSVLGKLTAAFVTIPEPILGGVLMVLFGMIASVGISNLQFVDLNSSRNLFVVGTSLLVGLAVPDWTSKNRDQIQTGSAEVDEVLFVLLSTSMFIGGSVAFFLDNTIPGTDKERGLMSLKYRAESTPDKPAKVTISCYDLPFGNDLIRRLKWTRYVPFCPNFLSHRSTKANSLPSDGNSHINEVVQANMVDSIM